MSKKIKKVCMPALYKPFNVFADQTKFPCITATIGGGTMVKALDQ